MSANPLESDPDREHRIRERAYHLWIDEGRPHGRDREFWERASQLIGMEDSARAAQHPNPQATRDAPSPQPVEEASVQENLGEFPDRLTDQGEVATAPKPKRAARAAEKPVSAPAPASVPAAAAPASAPAAAAVKPEKKAGEKPPAKPASKPKPGKDKAAAKPEAPGAKRKK